MCACTIGWQFWGPMLSVLEIMKRFCVNIHIQDIYKHHNLHACTVQMGLWTSALSVTTVSCFTVVRCLYTNRFPYYQSFLVRCTNTNRTLPDYKRFILIQMYFRVYFLVWLKCSTYNYRVIDNGVLYKLHH